MILHKLGEINKKLLVLASGSPRRKQLLEELGLTFSVCASGVDEDGDRSDPVRYVEHNALKKARDIYQKKPNADFVIGADTIVFQKNEILEKPKSKAHAKTLLQRLSGTYHTVVTGVAVVGAHGETVFSESTAVVLHPLTDEFIEAYIKLGDPMDKAGAYGIQGVGASFVSELNGCYYNVMGFPVSRFCIELLKLI